jgi:hypothetical protein
MMKSFDLVLMALVGFALIGAAQSCVAQFGGPMDGMGGGSPGGAPPGERQGSRGPVMASGSHLLADLQQQLDELRLQLKLRPEQERAWQAYQEQVGALMSDQLRPPKQAAGRKPGDAVHQIDRKVDVVRDRLAAMEDIADAARGLYDQLDAQQRTLADRALAATVPALYSGLGDREHSGGGTPADRPDGRAPPPH